MRQVLDLGLTVWIVMIVVLHLLQFRDLVEPGLGILSRIFR